MTTIERFKFNLNDWVDNDKTPVMLFDSTPAEIIRIEHKNEYPIIALVGNADSSRTLEEFSSTGEPKNPKSYRLVFKNQIELTLTEDYVMRLMYPETNSYTELQYEDINSIKTSVRTVSSLVKLDMWHDSSIMMPDDDSKIIMITWDVNDKETQNVKILYGFWSHNHLFSDSNECILFQNPKHTFVWGYASDIVPDTFEKFFK